MKLSATDRTGLERSVDARFASDRSIVLRYAAAVQLRESPNDDAEVKKRLEANSLGEGARIIRLLSYRGVEVSVLDETSLMATGTLKAVDGCLTASLLQASGVTRVAFESGGNTGAALTSYGSRAGIETFFFCPADNVDLLDSRLFRRKGAHLVAVERADFVKEAARLFCLQSGIRHAPEVELRYGASMFRGLFLVEKMLAGLPVDCLVQSVSAAFGPIGIYRVLRTFARDLPGLPKFIGVQQAANAPMAAAWHTEEVPPRGRGSRLLSRVMYDVAPETYDTWHEFQGLLSSADGTLVTVDEDEFSTRLADAPEGTNLLERLADAGIAISLRGADVVEKTGLMALVGTLQAIDRGLVAPGGRVLCCLTGGVTEADGLAVPEVVLRTAEDVSSYVESVAKDE